jgi:hypothetical protein
MSADSTAAGLAGCTTAEQFLIWACRHWVAHHRSIAEAMPRLRQGFAVAGVEEAVLPFHCLMTVLAEHHTRPLDLRCGGCRALGTDEALLLRVIGGCQRCCYSLAASLLQDCLPIAAARAAADHADRVARHFAAAGFVLPVRQVPTAPGSCPDRGLSLLQ